MKRVVNEFLKSIQGKETLELSISDGAFGDLLILINLYEHFDDKEYLDLIDRHLEHICQQTFEITEMTEGLLIGPLGLLYVLDILCKKFNSSQYNLLNHELSQKLKQILQDIIINSIDNRLDYRTDYMFGMAGIICLVREHSILSRDFELILEIEEYIKNILIGGKNV